MLRIKGLANLLSHDCHFDIDRDVSTAHCRSSSGDNVDLLSRTICTTVVVSDWCIRNLAHRWWVLIQSIVVKFYNNALDQNPLNTHQEHQQCAVEMSRSISKWQSWDHRQPKRTMFGFGLQRSFGRNILELIYYLMPNKCKNLKDTKSSCLSICTSSL